ncbi:hypothetical protein I312_105838 [Cryptococcus bacillisporus CA1280]|uniref:uncharacterized protein n=1 Tax=Cryptococcus bacillisporus CA1280 TaxID=1296109 RepID=UPI003368F5FE
MRRNAPNTYLYVISDWRRFRSPKIQEDSGGVAGKNKLLEYIIRQVPYCCSVFKHEQCITYIAINVTFRTLERPSI